MKYKSTLFDEARNKIGSVVASANKDGNYFRAKVTPRNPKSAAQMAVRSTFTANSRAWRELTDPQRMGWTSLAAQVTLSDTLGNKYKPSGQQLYVSCNSNLASIGAAAISAAPGVPDTPTDLSGISVTAEVGPSPLFVGVLTVALPGTVTGSNVLIEATALYSQGRSFVGRSQFRSVVAVTGDQTAGDDIHNQYQAVFGPLAIGSKLSVRAKSISPSGFASLPFRMDTIVVAI